MMVQTVKGERERHCIPHNADQAPPYSTKREGGIADPDGAEWE